ncbi:hypothetical protein AHAS_Ahas20G0249000 [Arachis hypogaea]
MTKSDSLWVKVFKAKYGCGITSLKDVSLCPIAADRIAEKLSSFTNGDGEWNWETINSYFSEDISEIIRTLKAPHYSLGADCISCWLIYNNALLTNAKRRTRGLTMVGSCSKCLDHEEILFHVLCDCPYSRSVWTSRSTSALPRGFFNQPLQDWLKINLFKITQKISGTPWSTLFVTVCNNIWKAQNDLVFNSEISTSLHVHNLSSYLAEQYDNMINLTESRKKILNPTKAYLVSWEPPVNGCIKLNVDGSVIQPAGSGTYGGLFGNGDGNLVAGFMMKIGRITITFAKFGPSTSE